MTEEQFQEKMESFRFNKKGETEIEFALKNPVRAIKAILIAEKTQKDVNQTYEHIKKSRNNEKDAYRHILFSVRLAREFKKSES